MRRLVLLLILSTSALSCIESRSLAATAIDYDKADPRIAFAVGDLKASLDKHPLAGLDRVDVRIAKDAELQPEGFRITSEGGVTTVVGADSAGAMYGVLELAEQIAVEKQIIDGVQNPYMKRRGTKFNASLDVRSPTYTEPSDTAQNNIPEMWSYDFWTAYIDGLARKRYNFISFWSEHPFASMVRVPEYPDVALDDVRRSTVEWEEHYDGNGTGFDAPEIVNNYETLKKMTIDEKIAFWRRVMRYGKERNVDFHIVTWNIFVHGTDGKYGITDDIDNPTTADYFRCTIREMFLTYPDLAGVGLTTGENMPRASTKAKEDWAFRAYAQGVLDAAEKMPGRKITFIHRQHQTGALDIADKFQPLIDHPDIDFIFSFKYAKAHVFSSLDQVWHPKFVEEITSRGDLKTIWTLRNDDNFYFRWGAPDFVRDFVRNIPYDVSDGYYYGSDQWVWGREFLKRDPSLPPTGAPRELELDKHWYHWMLWGRLGYDPDVSNDRIIAILAERYPEVDAAKLFEAWQSASMIYPLVTGFHWGALDFQWYIEACQSRSGPAETESGFHDINRFITLPPHPGRTDFISIPNYVKAVNAKKELDGQAPPEIAMDILANANLALEIAQSLDAKGNEELAATIDDIKTIAYLGQYYGWKILGATDLALARAEEDEPSKQRHTDRAVDAMTEAAKCWRLYTESAMARYKNPLWTNRVGHVDWVENYNEVLHDIEIAGGEVPEELKTPLDVPRD